jgi:hypothetical protein
LRWDTPWAQPGRGWLSPYCMSYIEEVVATDSPLPALVEDKE